MGKCPDITGNPLFVLPEQTDAEARAERLRSLKILHPFVSEALWSLLYFIY